MSQDAVRITAVHEEAAQLFLLVSVSNQANSNAAGQVYATTIERGGKREMLLSVADPLSALWVSPNGNLWAGSSAGNIWTTAPVTFGSAPVDLDATTQGKPWVSTTLPKLRRQNVTPNVICLFGFSDELVFAGTFEGAIYRWNGSEWSELETPSAHSVKVLHGLAPNDVYAACDNRTMLHFDGATWTGVPMPADVDDWALLTGLRALSPDVVVACDLQGTIYSGNAQGMSVVERSKEKWRGLARWNGRTFLASAPGGAWELVEGKTVSVRSTFTALGVSAGADSLYFIDEVQKAPSFIHFHSTATQQWGRRGF